MRQVNICFENIWLQFLQRVTGQVTTISRPKTVNNDNSNNNSNNNNNNTFKGYFLALQSQQPLKHAQDTRGILLVPQFQSATVL